MREAIRFLTVVPLPGRHGPMTAAAAVWFPVVGALIGLAGAAAAQAPLPLRIRPLAALAVWLLLTGALHEDGLADCFDAFGGGRTRQEVLGILKDSRVGTYGALALLLSLLARFEAMAHLPGAALVAAQALPRAGIVALAWLAGPATEGMGGAWAQELRRRHVLAAAAAGAAIAAAAVAWKAAVAAAICAAVVMVAALYFRRRIGGITGDCLGAAEQIQEIGVLVWLAV